MQQETYYTPRQLGRAWGLREGDVKLLFANDLRMEKIQMMHGRPYFRIPESAAMEVYEQHGQTWGIFLTSGEKTALAVGFAAGIAASGKRHDERLEELAEQLPVIELDYGCDCGHCESCLMFRCLAERDREPEQTETIAGNGVDIQVAAKTGNQADRSLKTRAPW